jgi:hypothetical protein
MRQSSQSSELSQSMSIFFHVDVWSIMLPEILFHLSLNDIMKVSMINSQFKQFIDEKLVAQNALNNFCSINLHESVADTNNIASVLHAKRHKRYWCSSYILSSVYFVQSMNVAYKLLFLMSAPIVNSLINLQTTVYIHYHDFDKKTRQSLVHIMMQQIHNSKIAIHVTQWKIVEILEYDKKFYEFDYQTMLPRLKSKSADCSKNELYERKNMFCKYPNTFTKTSLPDNDRANDIQNDIHNDMHNDIRVVDIKLCAVKYEAELPITGTQNIKQSNCPEEIQLMLRNVPVMNINCREKCAMFLSKVCFTCFSRKKFVLCVDANHKDQHNFRVMCKECLHQLFIGVEQLQRLLQFNQTWQKQIKTATQMQELKFFRFVDVKTWQKQFPYDQIQVRRYLRKDCVAKILLCKNWLHVLETNHKHCSFMCGKEHYKCRPQE